MWEGYVYEYVHRNVGASGGQRYWIPCSQSCRQLTWMLGTELGSCARAVSAPNPWSPVLMESGFVCVYHHLLVKSGTFSNLDILDVPWRTVSYHNHLPVQAPISIFPQLKSWSLNNKDFFKTVSDCVDPVGLEPAGSDCPVCQCWYSKHVPPCPANQ